MKRKFFDYGGVVASVILLAFGIGAIVIGFSGHSEVGTDLQREQIVGTPDMTPSAIQKEIAAAKLTNVQGVPTCSVAGQKVDTGAKAKCFAEYMRIHALEATGGKVYAEMGRYLTPAGKETDDPAAAAKNPKTGQPVPNGARDTWVTETSLATALSTSYFAQQVSLFSIIMGFALLLTGAGFLVFTIRHLRKPAANAPVAAVATPERAAA